MIHVGRKWRWRGIKTKKYGIDPSTRNKRGGSGVPACLQKKGRANMVRSKDLLLKKKRTARVLDFCLLG